MGKRTPRAPDVDNTINKRAATKNPSFVSTSRGGERITAQEAFRGPENQGVPGSEEEDDDYVTYYALNKPRHINPGTKKDDDVIESESGGAGPSKSKSTVNSTGSNEKENSNPKDDTEVAGDLTGKGSGDADAANVGEATSAKDSETEGLRNDCTTMNCSKNKEKATGLGKILSIPSKLVGKLFRQKISCNPLDILLSDTRKDVTEELEKSLNNMGSFKSVYLWDSKELGILMSVRDIVHEVAEKTKTKIFSLENFHTELIMRDQFQRINNAIERAIRQSTVSPCILFIEQIDVLLSSVEGSSLYFINGSLTQLLVYPILLVVTTTKNVQPTDNMRILFLGVGHKIIHLRRPNEQEVVRLCFQIFMKNINFALKTSEIENRRSENCPVFSCVDCLKICFDEAFPDVIDNILEICKDRTAFFIHHFCGILYEFTEQQKFKEYSWPNYFHNIGLEINKWQANEMGMLLAIRSYDR